MSPVHDHGRRPRPTPVAIGRGPTAPEPGRVQVRPTDQPPEGATSPDARPRLSFAVPPARGRAPRHLADLDLTGRKDALRRAGLPAFRADQLSRHYFTRFTRDAADMTDLPADGRDRLVADLLPDLIREVFGRSWQDKQAVPIFQDATSALYLGRGTNSTTAYEGALKMKEIAYVHAEAYPAGEMKHGPIALLEPGFPVVAIVPADHVHDKTVSNIQEVMARGATCVAVATDGDEAVGALCEDTLWIPEVPEEKLVPIVAIVHLQLLARYVARARGCDVDKPRNLAKSVTVE